MTVRTRFAPSPTGYMHIGGMRTALFNWLFARANGGTFILRIDDTDQTRNQDEALQPILDAFRWLGLDWNEGPEVGGPKAPYFQSQRSELYAPAVAQLLASGRAYRDFQPPAEVAAEREAAEKAKLNYVSSRVSVALTADEIQTRLDAGEPHVVRLLVPRDRKVAIDDLIRGHVEWDCALMPDPVIVRGDGSPLYNFATVIDDAQLEISHVIRAEEHLSNTPVQVLIYEALELPLPQFAHIPYVAAPGGKEKLSKRKIGKYRTSPAFRKLFQLGDEVLPRIGEDAADDAVSPVMVEFYRKVGFLPAGVLNALFRLGWSLDDRTENLSLETVLQNFSLDRVIKSPAGLDADKLLSYQSHWMGQLPTADKVEGCLPFLQQAGLVSDEADRQYIGRVIDAIGDRLTVFGDILQFDDFFTADETLEYDEKTLQKRLVKPEGAIALLRKLRDQLSSCEPFDAATTDAAVHDFVEAEGIGIGEIIHALRVGATGRPKGPGLFDCLELLGRERSLARIDRALEKAESAG